MFVSVCTGETASKSKGTNSPFAGGLTSVSPCWFEMSDCPDCSEREREREGEREREVFTQRRDVWTPLQVKGAGLASEGTFQRRIGHLSSFFQLNIDIRTNLVFSCCYFGLQIHFEGLPPTQMYMHGGWRLGKALLFGLHLLFVLTEPQSLRASEPSLLPTLTLRATSNRTHVCSRVVVWICISCVCLPSRLQRAAGREPPAPAASFLWPPPAAILLLMRNAAFRRLLWLYRGRRSAQLPASQA